MRLIFVLAVLFWLSMPSMAQPREGTPPFDMQGMWVCQKTSETRVGNPAHNYSVEATLFLNADRSVTGEGAVYNTNLRNAVQGFRAAGGWTYWAQSDWGHPMVQIRVQTSLGSWLNFWGQPIDANNFYQPYLPQQVQATGFYVEDNCRRAG